MIYKYDGLGLRATKSTETITQLALAVRFYADDAARSGNFVRAYLIHPFTNNLDP